MHEWVWDGELRGVDDAIVVEKNIDVDDAVGVGTVGGFGRSPHVAFDGLEGLKERERLHGGLYFDRYVAESVGRGKAPWFGVVKG